MAMSFRLKQCCCLSLRTGSLIIFGILLLEYVAFVIGNRKIFRESSGDGSITYFFAGLAPDIIVAVAAVCGIFMRIPPLMIPYLGVTAWSIIGIAVSLLFYIFCSIFKFDISNLFFARILMQLRIEYVVLDPGHTFFSIILAIVIFILITSLHAYLFWVVYSLYEEMADAVRPYKTNRRNDVQDL